MRVKVTVAVGVEVRMRIIHPYLRLYGDKVHEVQFVQIRPLIDSIFDGCESSWVYGRMCTGLCVCVCVCVCLHVCL